MPDADELEQAFASALAHHRAGRLADAERGYREILTRSPDHADALHLLGVVGLQAGDLAAALALVRRAIALRPDGAVYHNNLGQILERLGRYAEALRAYETALALEPSFAEAVNNLGHVLERQERLERAESLYREAIRLDPDYAEPHTNLGNVLKDRGELDAALAAYRRATELRPDLSVLHSNLLLAMHYHPHSSPADLARAHREWAARHVAPFAGERRPHANDPDSERRIRIGYVSPDFREHAITRFIRPLLEMHDRQAVEVIGYSDVTRPDAVTQEIRALVDQWRDVANWSDARLAEQVRDDRIDVLIDLAAHSGRNRLLVFARKPAPIQVSYLAYCSTTGVDAIDYRLTDAYLDPPTADAGDYVEASIHLPNCYWCYSAPVTPANALPPERRDGPLTFGCLNNFAKVSDPTLAVWMRLLERVPEARLLVYARGDAHRARVLTYSRSARLPDTRIDFVGHQVFRDYLDTYRSIDVALDPFPFGGGTTTCDALWMGVPVVSLAGGTAVSRAGSSLLSNVGLGQLVARNEMQYLDVAANLMRDATQRAELRRTLRDRLESSPVMNARDFTRNLEAVLRNLWHHWCAEQNRSRLER